jgi:uncharacterized protein YjbJ (UPF0337 family)
MKRHLKTRVVRQWKAFEGEVRTRWSKLSTDGSSWVAGRQDKLAVVLTKRCGFPREEAQRQVDEWASHLDF